MKNMNLFKKKIFKRMLNGITEFDGSNADDVFQKLV